MLGNFTIRPKVRDGESLSAYLYRICECNCVDFMSFIREIKKYKLTKNVISTIDITPQKSLDITELSRILKLTQNDILKMTHAIMLNKFYEETTIMDYKQIRIFWMEKKYRRFCPGCIKEHKYFKQIWQINQNIVCAEHLSQISCLCPYCEKPQPYVGSHLITFQCIFCNNQLSVENKISEIRNKEMLRSTTNWELLHDHEIPFKKICDLPKEDSNAIQYEYFKSLYDDDLKGMIYQSTIVNLKKNRKLNNNVKLTPVKLVNLLQKTQKSVFDYTNTQVALDYLERVIEGYKFKELGPCLSSWCSSYKSNNNITRVSFRYSSHLRASVSYCKLCHVKYAYNKGDNSWGNIETKFSSTIESIIKLTVHIKSFEEIKRKLGCSEFIFERALGYILARKIVKIKEDPIPIYLTYKSSEIFNILKQISQKTTHVERMLKKARVEFNLKPDVFFYFYYQENFQNYLFIEARRTNDRGNISTKNTWKKRIQRAAKDLEDNGEIISAKKISELLDCSNTTFKIFKLSNYIKELRNEQMTRILSEREKILKSRIDECLKKYIFCQEELIVVKIYKEIGISMPTIRSKHRTLYNYLNSQIQKYKRKFKDKVLKDKFNRAKEAVDLLLNKGEMVTIRNISRISGIDERYFHSHPEFKKKINKYRMSV